jgi:hypothetical protein
LGDRDKNHSASVPAWPRFAVVGGRRSIKTSGRFLLTVAMALAVYFSSASAAESKCPGGGNTDPDVLWCDDFEDPTPVSEKYFEYDDHNGSFVRVPGVGLNGSYGMRVRWEPGQVSAGNFKRTFGRNPVSSQSHSGTDFREIYWRQYLKMEPGWVGSPDKLSRAMILADSKWAQAMIAHLWSGRNNDYLVIDPASGIKHGRLATTRYNDSANLAWLGARSGATPVFDSRSAGRWFCIEAHVKLNTAGRSDGIFEFWVDNELAAGRNDLNWVDSWQEYGINAIFFENYWNDGAPGERIRYFDNIVISRSRIGCMGSNAESAPTRRK